MYYTRRFPDRVDLRVIFRVYAWLAWAIGTWTALWGSLWFAAPRADWPFFNHSLVRITGAAHAVVLLMVVTQWLTVWGQGGAGDIVVFLTLTSTAVLFYFWATGEGHKAGESMGLTELFGSANRAPIEHLRSEYEERIREAAGQEERNRLARELHDSIKQQLFVIQTAAATAQARFGSDAAGTRGALEQVRSSSREAMTEMEALLDQLRAAPLENVGLVEALKRHCEALSFRTGMQVDFEVGTLPPNESVPPGAQQAVFRVAQEALSNVARHARATRVGVKLESGTPGLSLKVQDNGRGFEMGADERGMGISNMRARAAAYGGTLHLATAPGSGTTVTLSIPVEGARWADRSDYRRRAWWWAAAAAFFTGIVVFDLATTSRREALPLDLAIAVVNLVIFIRVLVAYLRVRNRNHAGR
jgi:signal transduction histidine kinase